MKNQNNQNNNQPIGTYDPSQPIGYYYPTKQKKKHHVWLWVVVGIVVLSGIFGNAGKKSSKEDADQTKITDSDTTEMQIYEVEPKEDDSTTSDNAVPVPDTVENTTETPQTDNTDPVVTAENSEEQTGAEPDTKAPNSVEEEITNEPEIQTLLNTDTSPALVEPQIDAPEPIQPVQEIISLVPDEPKIQTISNSNISPDPVEQQLEEPVPIQPVQEIIPLVPDEPESGQPIVRMLDASQFLGEWYDGIPSKDENGQVIFIVNMETGKIHKPGCQYTNFSKYEYERAVTIYPNELIDSNPSFYSDCGKCGGCNHQP